MARERRSASVFPEEVEAEAEEGRAEVEHHLDAVRRGGDGRRIVMIRMGV